MILDYARLNAHNDLHHRHFERVIGPNRRCQCGYLPWCKRREIDMSGPRANGENRPRTSECGYQFRWSDLSTLSLLVPELRVKAMKTYCALAQKKL